MSSSKLRVVDLFAGAGGFSEGFVANGCDLVAHIEMDKDACDTIRTRMVYHALKEKKQLREYDKYLRGKVSMEDIVHRHGLEKEYESVINTEINKQTIRPLIKDVKEKLEGASVDILIGGPPCQAYSTIGRSSDRNRMKNDKRKYLFEYYVQFLKALKPTVFIFENVPGLLSSDNGRYLSEMQRQMKRAGYTTKYEVLNAADFGVPQNRKRVILVGWTNAAPIDDYPKFEKVVRGYTVADFLLDLPPLESGEVALDETFRSPSKLLKRLELVGQGSNVLLHHEARPHNNRDKEIYSIVAREKRRGRNVKYTDLPAQLQTRNNRSSFLDRYKAIDMRSHASHTVIAHIAKDGHYYIHPDPSQNRSLTVREAARLQTFPDDFKFEGERTSQFRQIGNAVPPLLSKKIAAKLVQCFNEKL